MTSSKLAHATIAKLPEYCNNGLDLVRQLTMPDDGIIEILDHKKAGGTNTGIFIDDIRMVRDLVKTSHKSNQTIVIFYDASKLTIQAQNALLKLLEEPRQSLSFILATSQPQLLLDTIKSRCQVRNLYPKIKPVDLPKDKQARVKFMAAGNSYLEQKLASDDNFYKQMVEVYELAKQFVSGEAFERLEVIASVKESRDYALSLINASLTVCKFMLHNRYSKEVRVKAKRLLLADEMLRNNANVRLALLTCVV